VALSSLAKLGMSVVLGISSTAGVSTLSTQLENGGPSVSWVTQDGVSVSGVHRLSASAAVALVLLVFLSGVCFRMVFR
jgi:hypothetical protein